MSELKAGKCQPYPEYQDSGVEWLGKIPSDWKVVKLKFSTVLTGEKTLPVNAKYVGMENVSSKNGKYIETVETAPEGISNSFNEGDVLFGKLRPYLAKSWLATFAGICSSEFLVLRSNLTHSKYLNYFMLTDEFIEQVNSSTYGSKMPRASWDFIGLLPMPVMGYKLSQKIANFLDHETAKIDTLIEKQQQLIKLLKEKRQAVISHAVTKGLNPQAPMKDSAVEWLGEVPEHWVTSRYKYCSSRVIVGIAEAATHAYSEDGTVLIRSTNIKEEGLRTSDLLFLKKSFAEQNDSKYLFWGDIVTVRTGYPGISAVIPEELDRSQCFTNLISTPMKGFLAGYLVEYLNSDMGKSYFSLQGWGSAQKNISVPILQEFPIAYPDIQEQKNIFEYICNQRQKFSALLDAAQHSITLMQERRIALISAAVTGKIDVRNWEQPND
ncbi:restriction endonuclease subunit S [Pseudoalteromonas sp. 5Ae-yellow]|uniref:restriction endonuclease subunit S n=1 Tax=Pseudoalteromonas sp. 5Ae-yellow TaxID=2759847 RepID=UPI0015F51252|nr:restriction endonuclease subunit S [Pseudoalteromonas sp. 5Ae-yellow]MBA6408957.1 restriction endonuclease subunit S [Pseudoalteromonas sp. 5Ae-yellow]